MQRLSRISPVFPRFSPQNRTKKCETGYFQADFAHLAEKERFELSHRLSQSTPLAGEPLRPLGYFSIGLHASMKVAEREGFEPPVPFDITSFQDWRLKPLGHLSAWA